MSLQNLIDSASIAAVTAGGSGSLDRVSQGAGGGRGVYTIGAVARMLELPVATIRNWEERYAAVVPERSAGGQRLN